MSRMISLDHMLNALAVIGVLLVFAWPAQPVAVTAQAQRQAGGAVFCATCTEWLSADGAQWNQNAQAFEIPLAVHRRFVRRDGYFVGLCVMIVDPNGSPVAELYHAEPIVPPRDKIEDILITLGSQIPWDRNRGTFSGPAGVCVMAQVFDPDGRPVKNADAESCSVVEIW